MINIYSHGSYRLEWKFNTEERGITGIQIPTGISNINSVLGLSFYYRWSSNYEIDFLKASFPRNRYEQTHYSLFRYGSLVGCKFLLFHIDEQDSEPILIFTNNTFYLQEHHWWLSDMGLKLLKKYKDECMSTQRSIQFVPNLIERYFQNIFYDTEITNTTRMVDFVQQYNERQIGRMSEISDQPF